MFVEDKRQGERNDERPVVHPSREGLAAWLKTKDPGRYYDWTDNCACACGQYAMAIGRFQEWIDRDNEGIWDDLNTKAGEASCHVRGTFGDLLKELVA